LPGLQVFLKPDKEHHYVAGCDPAEGNPTSDDSSITILDDSTGEEAALLAGKFQPSTTASYLDKLCKWYNRAPALVERNNHGHAVLLWLRDNGDIPLLNGWDGKQGWLTNSRGKADMYSTGVDAFKDKTSTLHSFDTYTQLSSIDGSTLSAPEGLHDDKATSYVLALIAMSKRTARIQIFL
jgi:hypothetical protein